jgi:Tol biopolymer transport system component
VLVPLAPLRAQTGDRCFEETGYCISGRIRDYWERNGGLRVFGYPLTPQREEQVEGQPYQVQWFERHRLELHPENQPPYDVLLGRIGVETLEQQGRDWRDFAVETPGGRRCLTFDQTPHAVCGQMLDAWRASGLNLDGQPGISDAESLALFGLPVSPVRTEEIEGQPYQVQWFERARFELHPENQPPYNVLFGLLGRSVLTYAGDTPTPQASERLAFTAPAANGNQQIALVNADGTGLTMLTDGSAYDVFPAWSPDGTQLAFSSNRDAPPAGRTSQEDIYVMNADGSNMRRLTDADGEDSCPEWSPDGTKIAFLSTRETVGLGQIYVMDADGSNEMRVSTDRAGCPTWTPDGTGLTYVDGESNPWRIYVVRLDGSEQTLWRDQQISGPVWSPDGTQLAFDRHDGIVLIDADGSNDRFLTVGSFPAWSPGSTRIAYTSYVTGQGQIHSIMADGTRDVRLTGPGFPGYMPVWSPSGSQIAFMQGASNNPSIVVVSADGIRTVEVARGRDPQWQP